jgi:hypothetical protein
MAKWTDNPAKLNILLQYAYEDNNMQEKHILIRINFSFRLQYTKIFWSAMLYSLKT